MIKQLLIGTKNRNTQVDLVRFLLCVFVVLFHYLHRYGEIYNAPQHFFVNDISFVVAIFFIISGYFASYKGFVNTTKSKVVTLYFPFVLVALLVFGFLALTSSLNGITVGDLAGNVLVVPLVIGKSNYVDGAHWFVVVLLLFFAIYILVNLFASIFKSKKDVAVEILIAILFLLSFGFSFTSSRNIVLKLARVLFNSNFVFICFGFFLRKAFDKKRRIYYIASLLTFGCLCFKYLYSGDRSGFVLFLFLLFVFVVSLFKKIPIIGNRFPSVLGQSSLFVYLIHQQFGYVIINLFDRNFGLYFLGVICSIAASFTLGLVLFVLWNILKERLFNNERERTE